MPPGLPTPPEWGIDAVVVFDPSFSMYRTCKVDTGLYVGISNADAAVVINDAFVQIGSRGTVGMYQELLCKSKVVIPSGCGLRGLGPTYFTGPTGFSLPGLTAVTGFLPPADPLVSFPAGNDTCFIDDLTLNANSIAANAAKIGGDHGIFAGVSFIGGADKSLWIAGQGDHFYRCNAVGPGSGPAGPAAYFDGPDTTWIGGWWRNPGPNQPAAQWTANAGGNVLIGVHSIGGAGNANLLIAGNNLLFDGMYVDGAGTGAIALVRVAGGVDVVFSGCQFKMIAGVPSLPMFRLESGPVVVSGCQSYLGLMANPFSKVAEITATLRARFVGCDLAGLTGAPTIDNSFTG